MKTRSLRLRFAVPVVLVSAILVLGGSLVVRRVLHARVQGQIVVRGESVFRFVLSRLDEATSWDMLQEHVAALSTQPDIEIVLAVGGRPSRVCACTKEEWNGLLLSELPDAALRERLAGASPDRGLSLRVNDQEGTLDIQSRLPLRLEQPSPVDVGETAILVRLDVGSHYAVVDEASWIWAWLSCGTTVVALMVVMVLLEALVLRPTRNLADVIDRRASEDGQAYAVPGGSEELARTAVSLNRLFDLLTAKESDLRDSKEMADALNSELRAIAEYLEETKIEAVAANEAKSAFLANMSHEIRTPMTAIMGFAEALLDSDQSESDRLSAIQTIRRNGEHLLSIINDILDLSKIEAGKLELESVPTSLAELIEGVMSLMLGRAQPKGIALTTETIGVLPARVVTDPTRLRQVLLNLIGNSIKFTQEGGVRLIVRLGETEGHAVLQFDVVDTGIGMKPEDALQLFQPFTQADASVTRRFGGTGLGLTISKRLAQLLGGDVSIVDTEPGVGTRFRATVSAQFLDGATMEDNLLNQTAIVPAKQVQDQIPLQQIQARVLLAEDGPDNQRLITLILRKAGIDVTVVDNGSLAIDAALEARAGLRPFDVILMDMQMPILDGYEAVRLLREKGYDGIIIALTAHAMSSDRDKCIQSGCDDYATKPINRQRLLEMISNRVNQSRRAECPL